MAKGFKWPKEIKDWIYVHKYGVPTRDMADMVNERFGTHFTVEQIRFLYKNNKWTNSVDPRFPKGHVPWTYGKKQSDYMSPDAIARTLATRFKPGEHSYGAKYPVNTITMRSDVSGGFYMWIKVAEPRTWKQLHIYVWEKAHGKKKPKGSVITFLDGDRYNFSLDNLYCITKSQCVTLSQRGLRFSDGNLTKAAAQMVKLEQIVKEKSKEIRQ